LNKSAFTGKQKLQAKGGLSGFYDQTTNYFSKFIGKVVEETVFQKQLLLQLVKRALI
jgi:hypothetical protein